MINIQDISVSFSGKTLFEEADFVINYGEKIGLIGRNGSGKSTFIKLLLGKVEPDSGNVDIPSYYSMGHLEQHIHFTHKTALEEVCSVLELERAHEEYKAEQILQGLGFKDEQLLEDPMKLSGGWQIKINLAKVLLQEPSMLLMDEPTNYLDIYSIRWLGEFLKKWEGEIILITHDRSFMDSLITHTLLIHRGRFRKIKGKTGKIQEQIEVEEEIHEKTRVNEEQKRKVTEDWIKRFGAKASKATQAQSRIKALEKQEVKVKLKDIANLDFRFNYKPTNMSGDAFEVKNLSFGYPGQNLLMENLSFKVGPQDKVCIVGKNGNGKSTLLKLVSGELMPLKGEGITNGKVEIGYFGQMNLERLSEGRTIVEELENVAENIDITTVRRTAAQMLFSGDDAFKKISVLSGGEKSRVMLGKILLKPVNVLLLDEPTNHLDMESSEVLMESIKEFQGAVLMVTHNEYFLRNVATKLIVFDGGKTFAFNGTYNDFIKEVGWKE